MKKNTLLAVRVEDRENAAVKLQQALTKHGCGIAVRLGLHDQEEGNVCSPCGTMILQLSCPPSDANRLVADLSGIAGVKAMFVNLE